MLFFCLNYLVFYITGKNVVFTLFSIFFSRLVDGYERKKRVLGVSGKCSCFGTAC